jgi:hypothetical protein
VFCAHNPTHGLPSAADPGIQGVTDRISQEVECEDQR